MNRVKKFHGGINIPKRMVGYDGQIDPGILPEMIVIQRDP
jgi:hypothetical protein